MASEGGSTSAATSSMCCTSSSLPAVHIAQALRLRQLQWQPAAVVVAACAVIAAHCPQSTRCSRLAMT
jgi:hypothetical protein